MSAHTESHTQCSDSPLHQKYNLPHFVVVEVGLVNAKNMQDPPLQISEMITIMNESYLLTGAIIMRPGHFYSVVQAGGGYVNVDGLPSRDDCPGPIFKTFSGAVRRDLKGFLLLA